jgi:mycothiol synthase
MSDPAIALPAGYRLRPPAIDEAMAVDRLSAACDVALDAPATLTEALLRRLWARPHFELATDAWIVEHDAQIVGYAQVWAESTDHLSGFALVHPHHTGRGLGTALAALVEQRGAELVGRPARLHSATIPQDEAATRLLSGRGYAFVRRFWHMEVALDGPDAAAPAARAGDPSPGITIRTLDPDRDLPSVHAILEAALADHWDWTATSYEEFLDQNVRQDDFEPALWFIAVDAGQVVGALTGSAHEERGSVDLIGVLRSHRGQGIASTLLRTAFDTFRDRGLSHARLSVDSANPTGAVSLYERMGMRPVASYDLWERTIE